MSKKLTNSDLFLELSEQEQEMVCGGLDFFIQKTDITSLANHEYNISEGSTGVSSKQNALYNYSQITFGFNLDSLLGEGSIDRVRKYGFSPLNLIYKLLLYLLQ